MGGMCNKATPENNAIEKKLQEDKKLGQREVKVLLLGTGESGKSTIFKQMKLLQTEGFPSPEELQWYKWIIYLNTITQMKIVLECLAKTDLQVANANRDASENIRKIPSTERVWNQKTAEDIKKLWLDPAIKEASQIKECEKRMDEAASYLFDNIDRFADPNFVPSPDDILKVRVRTTGIDEAKFKMEELTIRLIDVGGQRSERRKWIHCFQGVEAVIFIVASSEYNQMLREDDTQGRLEESLNLFSEISNSHWFKTTTFLLFLNKTDIFKQKYEAGEFQKYFTDYQGGSFEDAQAYFQNLFVAKNTTNKTIHIHWTIAIDQKNISIVFQRVKELLLKRVLDEVMLT
jgi:signal recognition particle receptor subunit beta